MKAPATRLAWLLVALMAAAALAVPMPEEEETSTLSPKPAAGRKKSKNKNPFSLEDNVSGLHPLTVMDVALFQQPVPCFLPRLLCMLLLPWAGHHGDHGCIATRDPGGRAWGWGNGGSVTEAHPNRLNGDPPSPLRPPIIFPNGGGSVSSLPSTIPQSR